VLKLLEVRLERPDDCNLVLGQAHFIKTVEDLHEAMATGVPGVKFGLAFCEASGPCLVRHSGTDAGLEALAAKNALALGCGHSFLVIMRGAFPINVLPALREVTEVCSVFCATANPVTAVVAETDTGRGILGVIDGERPKGVESDQDKADRKAFLRKIGYKL